MNLEKIRADTKGSESIIHLNNAGASLMPSVVTESIKNYLSREELEGGYELADKLHDELNLFYDYAAKLINAKSHNMAFLQPMQPTVITGHCRRWRLSKVI